MPAIIWSFLTTWGLTGLLAGVLVFGGAGLCGLLGLVTGDEAPGFSTGRSFFVGLAFHLTLFRLLDLPLGTTPACWASLGGLLVAGIFGRRAALRPSAGVLMTLPILWIAFTITTLAWWQPISDEVYSFALLGSIHSGRYANIALYIAEGVHVPRLNQPYGQSLLTATNLVLGAQHPVAALSSWLPTCLTFLTVLLHGFFRGSLARGGAAIAATFLVLFANLALSTSHILSLDNGSPLAMMGYSDAILGAATWLLFVVWWYRWRLLLPGAPPRSLALVTLFGFTWTMSAAQDIILAAPALALDLAAAVAGRARSVKRALVVPLALGAATVVGALHGGLFVPPPLMETPNIPGSSDLWNGAEPLMTFSPSLWIGVYRRELHTWALRLLDPTERSPLGQLTTGMGIAFGEGVFFPLLGVVALALLLALGGSRDRIREPLVSRRFWTAQATLSLVAGFAVAYLLAMRSLKWPLTRFLIPGAITGLVCLALAVDALGQPGQAFRLPRWAHALVWAAVVLVATVGPLRGLVTHIDTLAQSDRLPGTAPLETRLGMIFLPGRQSIP